MKTMSISEAQRLGLPTLVGSAESGVGVSLTRNGQVVAEIVSSSELESLRQDRETLRDAALVMGRFEADSGVRADLDEAMKLLGISREGIEQDIDSRGR